MIREATSKDVPAITEIYNYYIEHTVVTFEEERKTVEEMDERIKSVKEKYPWIVMEVEGEIVGYAYATEWKSRSAYRFTAESTVYLKNGLEQKGYGTLLYQALIELLKERKIHCVIAGIVPPNPASIRLHEKLGFQKVGIQKEVGYKFNKWEDVGYWQLILP
ncbi:MAG: arsinothricin resistance N-acetyltransferase ArsN1 family B [Chitinophagales bacterium]